VLYPDKFCFLLRLFCPMGGVNVIMTFIHWRAQCPY